MAVTEKYLKDTFDTVLGMADCISGNEPDGDLVKIISASAMILILDKDCGVNGFTTATAAILCSGIALMQRHGTLVFTPHQRSSDEEAGVQEEQAEPVQSA